MTGVRLVFVGRSIRLHGQRGWKPGGSEEAPHLVLGLVAVFEVPGRDEGRPTHPLRRCAEERRPPRLRLDQRGSQLGDLTAPQEDQLEVVSLGPPEASNVLQDFERVRVETAGGVADEVVDGTIPIPILRQPVGVPVSTGGLACVGPAGEHGELSLQDGRRVGHHRLAHPLANADSVTKRGRHRRRDAKADDAHRAALRDPGTARDAEGPLEEAVLHGAHPGWLGPAVLLEQARVGVEHLPQIVGRRELPPALLSSEEASPPGVVLHGPLQRGQGDGLRPLDVSLKRDRVRAARPFV